MIEGRRDSLQLFLNRSHTNSKLMCLLISRSRWFSGTPRVPLALGPRQPETGFELMTLSLDEFLQRFLLHVLPKGFVRIRHFGFLANRRRATFLPLCLQLLGALQPSHTEPEASPAHEASPLPLCPKCGGRMVVIERLTAAQIQLCSPPSIAGVAA